MIAHYKFLPIGTVRGPYYGLGSTQFMAKGEGGWVTFNVHKWETEDQVEQKAIEWAKAELTRLNFTLPQIQYLPI
jgi:hypothetical protein